MQRGEDKAVWKKEYIYILTSKNLGTWLTKPNLDIRTDTNLHNIYNDDNNNNNIYNDDNNNNNIYNDDNINNNINNNNSNYSTYWDWRIAYLLVLNPGLIKFKKKSGRHALRNRNVGKTFKHGNMTFGEWEGGVDGVRHYSLDELEGSVSLELSED
eukprot:GHVR01191597.1.p1 GENE.GHVR01191597.1~~GHVR01191597.1.p1  ORF type:complete len:156 (+),score=62.85 GHVR01191597.1:280-747(+)